MQKKTAVILLNWNTSHHTENCINSINTYCDKNLFDIIVADNGSSNNSLEYLTALFPDVIFIDNKTNLGFAEGNNRALQYSIHHGYTYSLIINNDTLVDNDLIGGLMSHLEQHSNAAAVQPAIYWMHDKGKIWNGEGKFHPLLGITYSSTALPEQNEGFKKASWLTGCCMLVKNAALVKAGAFNDLFFLYYEDVELSYRLRSNGYELHYLPTCHLYHEAGVSATFEKKEGSLSPIIHYYISRNHIWFLRKYGNGALFPINFLYNGAYYLSVLLYFLIRGRKQKARKLLSGLKNGLFTPLSNIYGV